MANKKSTGGRQRKDDLVLFPDELPDKKSKSHNQTNNVLAQLSPKYDKVKAGDVQATMSLLNWRAPLVKSDEELIERWDWYFEMCYKKDVRPTIEGLAVAAGTSCKVLFDWETKRKNPTPLRGDIVQKAKAYVRYVLSTMATQGKVNPVTFIFMAKNYFGMVDKVEHVVEQKDLLSSTQSADEVRKKIQSSIPLEDIQAFDDIEYSVEVPTYSKQDK